MKPPKKKQPVKARKMWLLRDDYLSDVAHGPNFKPVFVLPATQEVYDAMRYQVARETFCGASTVWSKVDTNTRAALLQRASDILAAIGITPPTK